MWCGTRKIVARQLRSRTDAHRTCRVRTWEPTNFCAAYSTNHYRSLAHYRRISGNRAEPSQLTRRDRYRSHRQPAAFPRRQSGADLRVQKPGQRGRRSGCRC